MKSQVLIVDDEPNWVALVARALRRQDRAVTEAGGPEEALAAVRDGFDGVVVLDHRPPDRDGLALVERLRHLNPALPIVVMTARGAEADALAAQHGGVCQFVSRSEGLPRLLSAVHEASPDRVRADEAPAQRHVADERFRFGRILTRSASMRRVFETLSQVIDSRVTLLLQGESGTGKELVARALHNESNRRDEPFVAVNCAGIPDALLESELFGHERGAFTGAIASRKGKFEQADGGTLFLDEIGEMPLHLQAKLLRVLQERQVERVGGVTLRPVDVRIISATHRDLMAMVRARRFREDLYYRLAVFPVTLPPLRDRPGDVALLARHFLGRYCAEEGKGPMALTVEALAALERHGFPGNVRELENLISRAVLLATSDRIGLAELPEDILGGQADSRIGPLDEAPGDASPLDAAHPGLADPGPPAHAHRALPSAAPGPAAPSGLAAPGPAAPGRTGCEARRPPGVPAEGPTRGSSATRTLETFARWLPERCVTLEAMPPLEAFEEVLLRHALTLADGQVVRAAQALGVSRATLYRRLRGQDPASGKAARPETDPEDP